MLFHCNKSYVLIGLAAVLAAGQSACGTLQPTHFGKFTFNGTVADTEGKPVRNAWVKVRGWETLTDANGKWQQQQIVHCGALADHLDNYEENDAVLVTASGYRSGEGRFIIKHPGYFQSCTAEQTIHFDTVLESESGEVPVKKETARKVPSPRKESPNLPSPTEKDSKGGKGAYTL